MNLKEAQNFIQMAKAEGVLELSLEGKDYKFSFSFKGTPAPAVTYAEPIRVAQKIEQVSTPEVAVKNADAHQVKSPFVGTFYGAPAPGKAAYVKVGDIVKVGQPLCILEAMKIMNEIDADISGEIVEICVENESLVEYGQPLFKIKKK